jgi:hypothetical protein
VLSLALGRTQERRAAQDIAVVQGD